MENKKENFPIKAIGDTIIIDPLPDYNPTNISLIAVLDPVKDALSKAVNFEGIVMAKGENVTNINIGDKVRYRKIGTMTPNDIIWYNKKMYALIVAGQVMLILPDDYVIQDIATHFPKTEEYSSIERIGKDGRPKNKYAKAN